MPESEQNEETWVVDEQHGLAQILLTFLSNQSQKGLRELEKSTEWKHDSS